MWTYGFCLLTKLSRYSGQVLSLKPVSVVSSAGRALSNSSSQGCLMNCKPIYAVDLLSLKSVRLRRISCHSDQFRNSLRLHELETGRALLHTQSAIVRMSKCDTVKLEVLHTSTAETLEALRDEESQDKGRDIETSENNAEVKVRKRRQRMSSGELQESPQPTLSSSRKSKKKWRKLDRPCPGEHNAGSEGSLRPKLSGMPDCRFRVTVASMERDSDVEDKKIIPAVKDLFDRFRGPVSLDMTAFAAELENIDPKVRSVADANIVKLESQTLARECSDGLSSNSPSSFQPNSTPILKIGNQMGEQIYPKSDGGHIQNYENIREKKELDAMAVNEEIPLNSESYVVKTEILGLENYEYVSMGPEDVGNSGLKLDVNEVDFKLPVCGTSDDLRSSVPGTSISTSSSTCPGATPTNSSQSNHRLSGFLHSQRGSFNRYNQTIPHHWCQSWLGQDPNAAPSVSPHHYGSFSSHSSFHGNWPCVGFPLELSNNVQPWMTLGLTEYLSGFHYNQFASTGNLRWHPTQHEWVIEAQPSFLHDAAPPFYQQECRASGWRRTCWTETSGSMPPGRWGQGSAGVGQTSSYGGDDGSLRELINFLKTLRDQPCLELSNTSRRWQQLQPSPARNSGVDGAGMEFTVMSYNILSQSLLEDNHYLYSCCRQQDLSWKRRGPAVLRQIISHDADIVCLQEVQADHWKREIKPVLKTRGYYGVFKKRVGDKPDGCAILYKRTKFSHLKFVPVEFQQGGILDRDNVGIILLLRPHNSAYAGGDRKICVATTHLLFNPRRGDVKLAQLIMFLAEIDKVAALDSEGEEDGDLPMKDGSYRQGSNHSHLDGDLNHKIEAEAMIKLNGCETFLSSPSAPSYCPIILCGDFNTEPHSDMYKFITQGKIRYEGLICRYFCGQSEGCRSGYNVYMQRTLLPGHLAITESCQYRKILLERHKRRLEVRQAGPEQESRRRKQEEEEEDKLHRHRSHASSRHGDKLSKNERKSNKEGDKRSKRKSNEEGDKRSKYKTRDDDCDDRDCNRSGRRHRCESTSSECSSHSAASKREKSEKPNLHRYSTAGSMKESVREKERPSSRNQKIKSDLDPKTEPLHNSQNSEKGADGGMGVEESESFFPEPRRDTGHAFHAMNFKSVYSHVSKSTGEDEDPLPEVSSQHDKCSATLDYIFFSSSPHRHKAGTLGREGSDFASSSRRGRSENSRETHAIDRAEGRSKNRKDGEAVTVYSSDEEIVGSDNGVKVEGKVMGEERGKGKEERELELLARYSLLTGDQVASTGHLPNSILPSDHLCLISQFYLR